MRQRYFILIILLLIPFGVFPVAVAQKILLTPVAYENSGKHKLFVPQNSKTSVQVSGGATINSGRDIILSNQEILSVNAGRDILLNGTTVRQNVSAGRDISGENCYLYGAASAGLTVRFSHCPLIMQIRAGDYITLNETTVHRNVQAGRGVSILRSLIEGDVMTGPDTEIRTSVIEGTLTAPNHHLIIDNSTVTNIRVLDSLAVPASHGLIVGNSIVRSNGQASVSVGPNSVSNINGYTVKGSALQTTLIAPDESVYVNGYKISGTGPDTYQEYRKLHAQAPIIYGPGWRNDASTREASAPDIEALQQSNENPKIVELINNSRVIGNIVFEGGEGKVIIRDASEFYGEVSGGVVEKN